VTARRRRPYQNVVLTADALADLRQIEKRSLDVFAQVFRLLEQLDNGTLQPTRVQSFAKTGDLTDCGKIVVLVDGEPEHRIVVRDVGGSFQVSEVVVVENRTDDLPYLLAGLRLERQGDLIRRSDASRRIARIRRALDQPDET